MGEGRAEMTMRWGKTSRSANGGVSALAVAETLAATGFSLWLVIWLGSWWHVFASAVIAPLFMLRSDASLADAANRFESWRARKVTADEYDWPVLSLFPRLLGMALWVRFSTTFRHFRAGLRLMPQNYVEALTESDLASGVSLVPETQSLNELVDEKTPYGRLGLGTMGLGGIFVVVLLGYNWMLEESAAYEDSIWFNLLFLALSFAALGALIGAINIAFAYAFFMLAIWLRMSVKSTALIWLPLFYLATRMPRGAGQTAQALKEECEGALPSLLRLVAWLSLTFFLWRAVIFPSTWSWWEAQDWAQMLLVVILPLGTGPAELSLWHIASGLSSVLTLAFYYLFWDRHARLARDGQPLSGGIVSLYAGVYWARGALSVYTIACSFWFVAVGAQLIAVPDVSWCLFPWLAGCS